MSSQKFKVELKNKSKVFTVKVGTYVKQIKPNYEQITITPSTEEQIIEGSFDRVTVEGDSNLISENIAEGKTIFGIEGAAKVEQDIIITPVNGKMIGNAITEINEIDLSNITNGEGLFKGLTDLLQIKKIRNSNKITNANQMFRGCNKVAEIGDFDISNVINCSYMFYDCYKLKKIPKIDISKATNISYMFGENDSIQNLQINPDNATNTAYLCYGCSSLETVEDMSLPNVVSANDMFTQCVKLKKVVLLDLSKATTMAGCFNNATALLEAKIHGIKALQKCSHLFYINTSLELVEFDDCDFSNVITIQQAFDSCSKLKNISGLKNLGKGYTQKTTNYSYYNLSFSSSHLLTHESLIEVIDKLYDLNLTYGVANGGTLYSQKLTLGSTNLAKLTADEIAIATNKGWTVA